MVPERSLFLHSLRARLCACFRPRIRSALSLASGESGLFVKNLYNPMMFSDVLVIW